MSGRLWAAHVCWGGGLALYLVFPLFVFVGSVSIVPCTSYCSHFHTTAGKKITKQYIDTMQRRSKTVAGGVRGRGRGRCPAAVQSAGPGQWTFPSSVYMCAMKLEALR